MRTLFENQGFRVFPLIFGTKRPAVTNGFRSDLSEIRRAFEKLPDCNIAVVCGHGLVVVDFERFSDFIAFYHEAKILSRTLVVKTTHRGVHVYVTTDEEVRRSIRYCEEHPLDLLGTGGYVVAPPSVIDHGRCERSKCHEEGQNRYEVISSTYEIVHVTKLYESISRRCEQLGWKVRGAGPSIREIAHGREQGDRNLSAFRLSMYLLRYVGLDEATAWELLLQWNERNRPPLDKRELRACFDSAKRRPYTEPGKVVKPDASW